MPHLAIDPVVAATAAVGALQPLVARETSPTTAAVVTVAEFNTGVAPQEPWRHCSSPHAWDAPVCDSAGHFY